MLELSAIPDEKYIPFIVGNFNKFGKSISEDTAKRVYALFQGHTYYIQKTFNEGFADTENNKECTISILQQSIDRLLSDNDTIFGKSFPIYRNVRKKCCTPLQKMEKPVKSLLLLLLNVIGWLRPALYNRL